MQQNAAGGVVHGDVDPRDVADLIAVGHSGDGALVRLQHIARNNNPARLKPLVHSQAALHFHYVVNTAHTSDLIFVTVDMRFRVVPTVTW
jgi:hypothetical protein